MLDAFTDFLKALGLPWEIITIALLWLAWGLGWGIPIAVMFWLVLRSGRHRKRSRRISESRPS